MLKRYLLPLLASMTILLATPNHEVAGATPRQQAVDSADTGHVVSGSAPLEGPNAREGLRAGAVGIPEGQTVLGQAKTVAEVLGNVGQLIAAIVAWIALKQIRLASRTISSSNVATMTQQLLLEVRRLDELPDNARALLRDLWTKQAEGAHKDGTLALKEYEDLVALIKDVFGAGGSKDGEIEVMAERVIRLVRLTDGLPKPQRDQLQSGWASEISRARGRSVVDREQHERLVEILRIVFGSRSPANAPHEGGET